MISQIITKLNEGGPVFTYPLAVLLFIVLALFVKGLIQNTKRQKTIDIIKQLSWLAIAWGFLGRTFGLIVAFDNLKEYGELTPSLLAEGLKMAILSPLLGIFIFIVARVCIITLIWIQKGE